MRDKGLFLKLGVVALVVVWAAFTITPPSKQLKGGIDLVGGTSLLYELDTTGLSSSQISGLSTRVMARLKVRVDPDQVMNLVWRPVGDTRLEIQMPQPPKQTIEGRKAFEAAVQTLLATNVRESQLVRAFGMDAATASAELSRLAAGVPGRAELFDKAKASYSAWEQSLAAKKPAEEVRDLEDGFAMDIAKVLRTNIDRAEVMAVLEMPKGADRQKALAALRDKLAGRGAAFDAVVLAHEAYAKVKGPLEDPDDLKRLLKGAGVLDFRILATSATAGGDEFAAMIKRLQERGPRPRPDDEYGWYEIGKPDEFKGGIQGEYAGKHYVLAYMTGADRVLDKSRGGWKLSDAYPTQDQSGMPAVGFEFNEIGAGMFYDLTSANIEKPLCILLDGKAMSAPNIQSAISRRGVITGKFTIDEVNYLVSTLNAGSLDARLKDQPISEQHIGPTLGQDNLKAGFRAGVWGIGAVLVFMTVYYLYAGVVANVALLLNLLFLLACMATMQATFTMPGIAGVILTMGMAVDANVLIFERIREESKRAQSLRLILKYGYDRAMPTILDANVTTLITCVVLYYIGTEEIKGFALTLGLGLCISVVTAVWVTRWVFQLLADMNIVKSLPMLQLFGAPNFNWLSKQKPMWVVSAVLLLTALIWYPMLGDEKYDIEFRGGTSLQVEAKSGSSLEIGAVRQQVTSSGEALAASGKALAAAKVSAGEGPNAWTVTFDGVSAERVDAAMNAFMEDAIERGSLTKVNATTITFNGKAEPKLSAEQMQAELAEVARQTEVAGKNLAASQVQTIGEDGRQYTIVTTATAQELISDALLAVMGSELNVQTPIGFNPEIQTFPITANRLGEVIGQAQYRQDVRDYRGGVAMVIRDLVPAATPAELLSRAKAMRQQPDFAGMQWRDMQVIGLTASGDAAGLAEDQIPCTSVAVVVADANLPYDEDENLWTTNLVTPELKVITEAMNKSSGFQQVTQFAPQVAGQAKVSALMAMLLSFIAITLYLWVRYGTVRHGLAAVVSLLHDVLVCITFLCIATWVVKHHPGLAATLGLQDFKMNLALVAALMTLIGFSVNDTIVIYDRIREIQGKREKATPEILNRAFNVTLARTVLTSFTVFLVMIMMYLFGGDAVRGFSFVMLIGVLTGTYSSVLVAGPLLLGWTGAIGRSDIADSTKAFENPQNPAEGQR
jgi:SecD/SecF fusion protein